MTEPEDPYRPSATPPPGAPQYGQQPQYGQPPQPGGYPPAAQYAQYAQYGEPPVSAHGQRASMGARFGGLLIDAIILGVIGAIIGVATGLYRNSSYGVSLIVLVLGCLYSGWLVGTQGQTVGHRAVGIRVVDNATGGTIGFGRGAIRWLVMDITGAICTLGYWSPFFNKERRGWHDMAANSIAVRAR